MEGRWDCEPERCFMLPVLGEGEPGGEAREVAMAVVLFCYCDQNGGFGGVDRVWTGSDDGGSWS